MPESKVISLDKRAEDKEKSFFEQLLQEGARKLMDYIQFHKDRRDEDGLVRDRTRVIQPCVANDVCPSPEGIFSRPARRPEKSNP